MSAEVLLISVIVVIGAITGWVKFRDQSIAEVNDVIGALDAYQPGFEAFGTRWISAGVVLSPTPQPITATFVQGGSSLPIPPGEIFTTLAPEYAPPVSGVGETF